MPMRLFSMFVLTAAVCLTGGCVKMKQVLTLMPDGSGKLAFVLGVSDSLAPNGGRDPLAQYALENLLEEGGIPAGVVAITPPERWEDDGFNYVAYTMYFEDINAFEAEGSSDLGEMFAAYSFEPNGAGDGGTLTVTGGMMRRVLGEYEQREPDEQEQMRKEMQGIEIVEQLVLPGAVEAVDGVDVDGSTASIVLGLDTLINADGPIAELDGGPMTLVVPEYSVDPEAAQAFAAEMGRAVAAWQELLEEMSQE